MKSWGSPPLARGRLKNSRHNLTSLRLTPACAGKTKPLGPHRWFMRAHPRLRGEDAADLSVQRRRVGSPPLARGRLDLSFDALIGLRLTPACAGKTPFPEAPGNLSTAHPRLRGEDKEVLATAAIVPGSPPLARGRLTQIAKEGNKMGLTPACAGKTMRRGDCSRDPGAHPRLRGED